MYQRRAWPRSRRSPALVLSLGLVLGLTSCGVFDDGPERNESGVIIQGGEIDAGDLEIGDCFNGRSAEVEKVAAVPCAEPHDFELYHSYDLAYDEFPGADVIEVEWLRGCLLAFEEFVATPFDESKLDISGIFPQEGTWNDLGDREVLCSVTALDGSRLSGSARNSNM